MKTSVVIASFTSEAALARCLASLEKASNVELIVATNLDGDVVDRLRQRFPRVRLLRYPAETNVFRLRALGVAEASGRLVCLTEDHCTVAPGWLTSLEEAHQAGHRVIAGPVENGLDGWALYLCEYGRQMPPLGPGTPVSAVNAAYDRDALWQCRESWTAGFHDNEVEDALRSAGHRPFLTTMACVRSHLSLPLAESLRHLFAGGRRFGGYRQGRSSPGLRFAWMLASPAVPVVLLTRILRGVLKRRPVRAWATARALPLLLCLLAAWSAGEMVGYLGGCHALRG